MIRAVLLAVVCCFSETAVECMDRVLGSRDVIERVAVMERTKEEYGRRYLFYYKVFLEVNYPEALDSCTTTPPPDTVYIERWNNGG